MFFRMGLVLKNKKISKSVDICVYIFIISSADIINTVTEIWRGTLQTLRAYELISASQNHKITEPQNVLCCKYLKIHLLPYLLAVDRDTHQTSLTPFSLALNTLKMVHPQLLLFSRTISFRVFLELNTSLNSGGSKSVI